MQNHNDDKIIKTSDTVLGKIYLSLYLKGWRVRGSWRPNRTARYWPPHSYGYQRLFSVLRGCSTGCPGAELSCLQTDWISCVPSYIIVHAHSISPHNWPSEYELPPSLEWHVWSSSSGNNCHAVHRSLSSGASVHDCTVGFLPCPILSTKLAHANGICTSAVLEWHIWLGRRSIYNDMVSSIPIKYK